MSDAGVVDQTVHAAQSFLGLGHELFHIVTAAHIAPRAVHGHAVRPNRGFGEEGLSGDVPLGKIEVVEGDGYALLGEFEARSAAEAGGAAGDDRDAALNRFGEPLGAGLLLHDGRPTRRGLARGQRPGNRLQVFRTYARI
jgi:hypothetical protein